MSDGANLPMSSKMDRETEPLVTSPSNAGGLAGSFNHLLSVLGGDGGVDKKRPEGGVSLQQRVMISSFNILYGLTTTLIGMIVLPYEAEQFFPGGESFMLAMMIFIVSASQLVTPWAGSISDSIEYIRLGRRRPVLLFGSGLFMGGIGVMAWASEKQNGMLFLVGLVLGSVGINIGDSISKAWLNDVSDQGNKGSSSGVNVALYFVGATFGLILVIAFTSDSMNFVYSCLFWTALFTTIPYTWYCVEYDEHRPVQISVWSKSLKILNDPEEADFMTVTFSRLFYYFGASVAALLMYYLRDCMSMTKPEERQWWVAMIAMAGQGTALLLGAPLGRLSDSIGRKKLVYTGCFFMATAYATFLLAYPFPPVGQKIVLMIGGGFFGLGSACFQAVDYALAMDCMANQRESATAMGLWSIAYFIGATLGSFVSGALLFICTLQTGKKVDPNAEVRYSYFGYACIMTIGALSMLYAAFLVRSIKAAD